jgi:hypothetical protein
MGIAASNAIIGPRLLINEPKILEDLAVWKKGVFKLAMGLPKWMLKDVHAAREKMIRAFMKWGVDEEEMTFYLKKRGQMYIARGIDRRDMATANFGVWTA